MTLARLVVWSCSLQSKGSFPLSQCILFRSVSFVWHLLLLGICWSKPLSTFFWLNCLTQPERCTIKDGRARSAVHKQLALHIQSLVSYTSHLILRGRVGGFKGGAKLWDMKAWPPCVEVREYRNTCNFRKAGQKDDMKLSLLESLSGFGDMFVHILESEMLLYHINRIELVWPNPSILPGLRHKLLDWSLAWAFRLHCDPQFYRARIWTSPFSTLGTS